MRTIHGMVIRFFVPAFVVATLFFVLILELVDLFSNISSYLANDVSFSDILLSITLYLPKCLSFALPISLLFSISFTMGNLYSNNELIAVFGCGIPLTRFVLPLLLTGLLFSVFNVWFEDSVVISTYRQKNELTNTLLGRAQTLNSNNTARIASENRIIYSWDFYNDADTRLSGVLVIERGEDGSFVRRVNAAYADWSEDRWILRDCSIYEWDETGTVLVGRQQAEYSSPLVDEPPRSFQNLVRNVDEMTRDEAWGWIESLQRGGLPFREAETDFQKKLAFLFTPLIVAFLSSAVGGRFRKNVLLMSLLFSLIISVVFFVLQMVLVTLAKNGIIFTPFTGAWGSTLFFAAIGLVLFRTART